MSALFKTAPSIDSETFGAARRVCCTVSTVVRPHSITSTYASISSVVAQTSITPPSGERSTTTNSYCFRNSSKTRFNSALERMEGGSGGPAWEIAGMNAIWVDGSFQITSSSDVPPKASSTIPLAALGVTERVSDGFLRSQSTTMTEAPLRAISCPSASATVDFPSFGVAEVSPMTLLDLDLFSKSIANLIDRTPSENRDIGWSIAVQLIPRSPRTKALGPLSLGVFFASHPFRFLFWTFGRRPMQGIRKCD